MAMLVLIMIKFYTIEQAICSTLFIVPTVMSIYHICFDSFNTITYFYIICYYFQMRTIRLNMKIMKSIARNNEVRYRTEFHKLLHEHNIICSQLSKFNQFWQKYYLSLIITIMPINLLFLISILFTELEMFAFITYISSVFYTWVFIFFISYFVSKVSKAVYLSRNGLIGLQLNITYNTRVKLKLMAFIEKLLAKRLIIGFSLSCLFVMTFAKLFSVSPILIIINGVQKYIYFSFQLTVMYCRYFILTLKMFQKLNFQ